MASAAVPSPPVREGWLDDPALAPEAILGRMAGENFPVALRALRPAIREALVSVYGVARLIDQVGDAASGDRLAILDALETDVDASLVGEAQHPLLRRLTPVARTHGLTREPFVALIDANRWDQRAPDLASEAELDAYCALSAAPVGALVLAVFGASTNENRSDSDRVCAALQVLEHCQDVAEDAAAGRCYLPGDLRRAAGVTRADLERVPAPAALCRIVEQLVVRAERDLARGASLCARLSGPARFAVSGFVGGGRATADALRTAGFDPNRAPVRPRKLRLARRAWQAWRGMAVAS
ncbi:MAG: squalene/phytoene synthase family protein [Myxococcota bacterium]